MQGSRGGGLAAMTLVAGTALACVRGNLPNDDDDTTQPTGGTHRIFPFAPAVVAAATMWIVIGTIAIMWLLESVL